MITRADWLVLALAAALVGALYAHHWGGAGPGARVHIAAAGATERALPLDADRELHVHGPLGDSVIEIKDGRVRFVSSPCRGQQCVHAGWLARTGELAACLPNGITVRVEGDGESRFDSINF